VLAIAVLGVPRVFGMGGVFARVVPIGMLIMGMLIVEVLVGVGTGRRRLGECRRIRPIRLRVRGKRLACAGVVVLPSSMFMLMDVRVIMLVRMLMTVVVMLRVVMLRVGMVLGVVRLGATVFGVAVFRVLALEVLLALMRLSGL
jgi:hypothetical protein